MAKALPLKATFLVRLHGNNRLLVTECKRMLLDREARGSGALAGVGPKAALSDGLVVSHALWYLKKCLADGTHH